MGLRAGIDMASVEAVSESLREHGDRYLQRVYTAREIDDSHRGGTLDPQRLAARFAAKEAAMKMLRVAGDEAVPWHAIEVVRQPGGWVALELHGRAAELAAEAGLGELAVSIAHECGYASAVVIAETREDSRYWTHER